MERVAAGGFDKQGILYYRAFALRQKNSYKDLLRSISINSSITREMSKLTPLLYEVEVKSTR